MTDDTVPAPADVEGAVFESAYQPRRAQHANLVPFRKGHDPRRYDNAHRPKGSKNVIGNAFVKDLMAWHAKEGMKAIKRVGETQPVELLKLIASFVPKRLEVDHEHTGSVTFAPVSVQDVERKTRELLARIIDGDAQDAGEG